MMLMLGDLDFDPLFRMAFGFWAANIVLLLPSFLVKRAGLGLLLLTALVTTFDGFFVCVSLWNLLHGAKSLELMLTVGVVIPFVVGCFGIVRMARLPDRDRAA